MQKFLKKSPVIMSAVIGFIFLIPLIVLELVNRWKFDEDFPYAVFVFTWFLNTAFILIVSPMVKAFRSKKSLTKDRVNFILRVISLIIISYIWTGWIVDQWPCLMGVPNCD